jgi:hypothetical protein
VKLRWIGMTLEHHDVVRIRWHDLKSVALGSALLTRPLTRTGSPPRRGKKDLRHRCSSQPRAMSARAATPGSPAHRQMDRPAESILKVERA